MTVSYLNSVEGQHTCRACELKCVWAGTVHDVIVRVPKWAGWSTRGNRKPKGLCTLELPLEAYFGFWSGIFLRAWRRSFFTFSSSSKVKIWSFLAVSSWFELRDCFAQVLGSFELVSTLFYYFFGKNDRTLSHWVFGHILVYCVCIFRGKRGFRVAFE